MGTNTILREEYDGDPKRIEIEPSFGFAGILKFVKFFSDLMDGSAYPKLSIGVGCFPEKPEHFIFLQFAQEHVVLTIDDTQKFTEILKKSLNKIDNSEWLNLMADIIMMLHKAIDDARRFNKNG